MVVENDPQYDGFRVFTYNTMTGKIWADIPVSDSKWSMRMNAAGSLGCGIPTNTRELEGLDIRTGTLENRMSLGVAWKNTILEGGPILERNYSADDEILDITAEGIWGIFNARKLLPAWAQLPGVEPSKVTSALLRIQAVNMASVVRELVRYGMENPPYNSGALPIVLPPVVAGTEDRPYNGFDLKWVGQALTDLTEEEGGPDIRFRPRFSGTDGTYVEYVLEVGAPYLRQSGPNHIWDGTVPGTGVQGFGAKSNGRNMAAKAWRPGQGQEQDMKLGVALDRTMLDLGWPWMEKDTASKQQEENSVLASLAAQDVQDAAGPEMTFSISVDANSSPELGTYLPGDWATVNVPEGHPLIPAGKVDVRLMGIDGDDSDTVQLTVAPVIGDLSGSPNAVGNTYGENVTPLPPYPADKLMPGYDLFPGELPPEYLEE